MTLKGVNIITKIAMTRRTKKALASALILTFVQLKIAKQCTCCWIGIRCTYVQTKTKPVLRKLAKRNPENQGYFIKYSQTSIKESPF